MPKSDPFSGHDVLHMASVMAAIFEDHLLDHPMVQAVPILKEQAEAIGGRLGGFYQLVGEVTGDAHDQREQQKAPQS